MTKRIIPLFLLHNNRLYKGTQFLNYVDVGDPVSQAMIYDAQGADEIVILDVSASIRSSLVDKSIITEMARKCRLPFSIGGGISKVSNARGYFKAGADKITINTHAVIRPELIKELVEEFGSQSVVVSIDIDFDESVLIYSGKFRSKYSLCDYLSIALEYGAGEILLSPIDRDGTLAGLNIELYKKYREKINVPLIASGGASSYDNIADMFSQTDADACAIGKMLFLRDYDIVRIKSYLRNKKVEMRDS